MEEAVIENTRIMLKILKVVGSSRLSQETHSHGSKEESTKDQLSMIARANNVIQRLQKSQLRK